VRYESALQIIAYLKRMYGTPVPILRIAESITLSYQPTHKHVRSLSAHGVIETAKAGRQVLCRLRASEATHVWLALMAQQQREQLLDAGGPMGSAAAELLGAISQMPTEGLEAVAVQEPADERQPSAVLLVTSHARDVLHRRFKTRLKPLLAGTGMLVATFAEVAALLANPLERHYWVAHSHPIHGEQRFWQAALPVGAVDDLDDALV